jgi:hypothetical protein
MPGEGKRIFNTDMLQLPTGGRGETAPLQLSGLQARERKDAT